MRKWWAVALLAACAAHAEPSAQDKLSQAQQKLDQERNRNQEISQKRAALEKELQDARENLVKIAADAQASEARLAEAESKLSILSGERQARASALATKRDELNAMISAAIRLSQAPPESAMMMPGDFSETLTAARTLSHLARTIRQESQSIGAELRELDRLSAKVERTRARMAQAEDTLKSQRATLEAQMNQRQNLREHLTREQEDSRKRLIELSKQARDLQDLMNKIEAERPAAPPPHVKKGKLRSFASAKGAVRLPASGRITQRFGQALGKNETSKGIVIKTGARGAVVAPFDGEVVFTGPFLAYGTIVILRHSDDFHTLLAGFNTLSVATGQFLLEGEPIGAMGEQSSKTELYVELRKQNQPIDPAPWMRGISR